MADRARRNRLTALTAGAVVAAMVGLSFAAVPLYRIFCQVTGYGGTTQVAEGPLEQAAPVAGARKVTVSFDANVNAALPWTFQPVQSKVTVRVGEQVLVHYRAENRGERAIKGVATFNVTPFKAGPYFDKVECFCFTEQTLGPGESADMPVLFFIDPAIVKDHNLDDVTDITLSYTFFRAPAEEGRDHARAETAPARRTN